MKPPPRSLARSLACSRMREQLVRRSVDICKRTDGIRSAGGAVLHCDDRRGAGCFFHPPPSPILCPRLCPTLRASESSYRHVDVYIGAYPLPTSVLETCDKSGRAPTRPSGTLTAALCLSDALSRIHRRALSHKLRTAHTTAVKR